jgi:hypothetical protein
MLCVVVAGLKTAAADHDIGFAVDLLEVFLQEIVGYLCVVVEEKEPFALCIFQEEVADACPSDVLVQAQVLGNLYDTHVLVEIESRRMVIDTYYLHLRWILQAVALVDQAAHQRIGIVVIYRYTD